ncbi:MAG: hypothetical protein WBJ37_01560 [Bacteroidales bacterium]
MNKEKENFLDLFLLNIRRIFSRDLGIFLIFLLIAFISWYLNSLRKETETTLKLQLNFINPPSDLAIANNSTGSLNLNLSGQGYSLLKFSMSKKNRILTIDLSSVKLNRKSGNSSETECYLLTSSVMKDYMNKASSAEIKVLSVKPDTLFIFLVKNSSAGKSE